jgi:predicted DNA-binding protein
MKTKIGVYLTDDVAKRLKTAARRSGTTKSDIVNEALDRFFNPKDEKDLDSEVLHRVKGLAKSVRRIHREVEIVAETLALHIRQFMLITPPVPKIDQAAARKLGNERYEVFVKEVAKRIASDSGIVADIMELILESQGDRFAQPVRNNALPPNSRPSEAAAHG